MRPKLPFLLLPLLASLALADPAKPAPKPVQLPDGVRIERDLRAVTSPPSSARQAGRGFSRQSVGMRISPVTYISEDDPPVLILHGTHDALVPYAQSVQFAGALAAQGVSAWLQTLPGSGHGGPAFPKPVIRELIQTFSDKFLKGAEVELALVPVDEVAVEAPKETE